MEVLKPIRQAKASPDFVGYESKDESDGELRAIHFELYSLGRMS
jgi:hypothetical protein